MGSRPDGAAQAGRHVQPATWTTRIEPENRIEPGNRVVITGAAGFIGSAVVRAVQATGAEVVAVVEPGADDRNLTSIDAERAVLDIRDLAAVRAACAGARFVFHLAAVYRFWARDPRIFYDVNVGGTLNVLDAVRAAGCERLLFTSTVGVLGLERRSTVSQPTRPATPTSRICSGTTRGPSSSPSTRCSGPAAEGLNVCLVLPTLSAGAR